MLARAGLILTLGVLMAPGCKPEAASEDGKQAKAPPPKVNLPPSPEMVEPRFVEKYADGSFTVAGLISKRAEHFNKEVKVKGYIKEIHRCADGAACDPPAHAVLVDDLARPRKRLVLLGGPQTRFPRLEQGEAVVLEGLYRQTDPKGLFVRMEGLLLLNQEAAPEPPTDATDGTDSPEKGDEATGEEKAEEKKGEEKKGDEAQGEEKEGAEKEGD